MDQLTSFSLYVSLSYTGAHYSQCESVENSEAFAALFFVPKIQEGSGSGLRLLAGEWFIENLHSTSQNVVLPEERLKSKTLIAEWLHKLKQWLCPPHEGSSSPTLSASCIFSSEGSLLGGSSSCKHTVSASTYSLLCYFCSFMCLQMKAVECLFLIFIDQNESAWDINLTH